MAESLAEFFLANFQAHREERAYGQRRGYRMEWFTYGQVLEMAFRFVGDLEARGICKGERVMLWGENCAEGVAAFFGGALGAVIVVPMDDGASAEFAGRGSGQVGAGVWVWARGGAGGCGAVLEFVAGGSWVWAIPGDVFASAVGWDGDLSGGVEAFGDCEYDSAGACLGAGECAESFAVAEAEDRARSGGWWEDR